jgi:polyisoprenoid-binding protein YceI
MTTLDPARSSIGFTIRHMGVATVRGEFTSFHGDLDDDGARLSVDAASVDTGNAVRDGRLRDEFFDAERFPALTFRADRLGKTIHGELTICGVTRPIALKADVERLEDHSVRLRAEGRIRRTDFGLDWDALRQAGRLLVADHVRVTADVVLTRRPSASRP